MAALFFSGGDGGIRTLDGLLIHTPLAGERFRPLSHVSEIIKFSSHGFESFAGAALYALSTLVLSGATSPKSSSFSHTRGHGTLRGRIRYIK